MNNNPLKYIYTLSIVIPIIFALIYLRIYENDFFREIILVMIPSALALFASKWVTQSWQTRTIRLKLQKEVLDKFANSALYSGRLLHTFVETLNDTYGESITPLLEGSYEAKYKISFPENVQDQPEQKFADEFKQLKKDYIATQFRFSEFNASFKLYYQNDELSKEFSKLTHTLLRMRLAVYGLAKSKSEDEFIKFTNKFFDEDGIFLSLSREFNIKLIKTNLIVPI